MVEVSCRWMNGDETVLKRWCATVGDIRYELCNEQDGVWEDVKLFDVEYRILTNDADDAPKFISVLINKQAKNDVRTWSQCLLAHARRGDGAGVRRVVKRLGDDAEDVMDQVWWQSMSEQSLIPALLDGGFSPHYGMERHGFSWLHIASSTGNALIAGLLLQHGADVHALEEYGPHSTARHKKGM